MSGRSDFSTLLAEIGAEFSTLGNELRTIGKDTLKEIQHDPLKYIQDSARDLTRLGVYHPLLEKLGGERLQHPDDRPLVSTPVEGSILYTDLFGKYAQHSGVYIGQGKIVELSGDGRIQIVSRQQFTSSGTGTCIYVSCRQEYAVGSSKVAQRALDQLGLRRQYNIVMDNCHQFSSGCLSGNFENGDNFLWALKHSTEKILSTNNWRIWE